MWLIGISFSYLLASIPFGYVVVHLLKGDDIRNHGSGNIGATNVVRVVGKKWGVFVFFLDFLKGFLPLLIFSHLLKQPSYLFFVSMAIASVVGHNWSLFLKFSGGKGVSTTAGVLSALCLIYPDLLYALAVAILIWIIIFLVFRYVSLASLLAVTVFTLYSLIFFPWEFKLFSIVIFSLIMIRHKRNIKKLLNKSELGF